MRVSLPERLTRGTRKIRAAMGRLHAGKCGSRRVGRVFEAHQQRCGGPRRLGQPYDFEAGLRAGFFVMEPSDMSLRTLRVVV
jgi:hypothetical protein